MNYVHLSATINGTIKDVLVSVEEFCDNDQNPANFFVSDAEYITNNGDVEIFACRTNHTLPDLFG